MKFTVNKDDFVNNLLTPVSKLADNIVLEFCEEDSKFKIKSLVTSSDNAVVFFSTIDCEVSQPTKCIIPDCKTFLRLFSNIDNEKVSLHFETNSINYKDPSTGFSFKYHLLDESYVVNKKAINEEKLNQLKFNTKFGLTKQKFAEILKYNSIIPDAEKMYFSTDDSKVLIKLGDDQKSNTNEIVIEAATEYTGTSLTQPIPLNIQNLLLFSFPSNSIVVEINEDLKILKFETSYSKYIVSGLVK